MLHQDGTDYYDSSLPACRIRTNHNASPQQRRPNPEPLHTKCHSQKVSVVSHCIVSLALSSQLPYDRSLLPEPDTINSTSTNTTGPQDRPRQTHSEHPQQTPSTTADLKLTRYRSSRYRAAAGIYSAIHASIRIVDCQNITAKNT